MAKAKKLPSGNWRIRIGAGEGGKTKSFTAPTKKECEIMAAEFIAGRKRLPSEMTVEQAIDAYIDQRSNLLSPSTIQGYHTIKKNYLGGFGKKRLCDIDKNSLQSFVNSLSEKYAPKTVYNTIGLVSSVLRTFSPETNTDVKLPPKKREIRQFPTPQEIIAAFKGSEIELPVLMALWLGMRMSEIRGANKADIEDGVLTIRRTVLDVEGEQVVRDATKTFYSTRQLRLPSYIISLIDALPAEQEPLTVMSGSMIYKRFIATLEKNNLPKIRFHDLRHLNASLMLSLGIPDKYAMERGGWSNPTIMRSVYQHTFDADRQKVDAIIDGFFNGLVG